MITEINQLSNGKISIEKGKKLDEKQLNALKWYCLNNGKINFLSKAQIKQLAEYCLSECDNYSSSHSMRFTIMRDFVKAIIF